MNNRNQFTPWKLPKTPAFAAISSLKIATAFGIFLFALHNSDATPIKRFLPIVSERFANVSLIHNSNSFSFLHAKPNKAGFYARATEDCIFKHIMNQKEARNSFLSAVIGEEILESELMDQSLNPVKSYIGLRKLINDEYTQTLFKSLQKGPKKDFKVINLATNRELPKIRRFLQELSEQYHELVYAFPSSERNTQLDLICQTKTSLINVEVQVEPQNFWDIRILDHVCGLFHRQFPRGFNWKELEDEEDINLKIRRVIGVSIFESPPTATWKVQEQLAWYKGKPWAEGELRRNYVLLDRKDGEKEKSGIEFFEYNLEALKMLGWEKELEETEENLAEWLDLLANAHMKTQEQVEGIKNESVREAYDLIKSRTLPKDLKKQYEQQQSKRSNISHHMEYKIEEGIKKGQAEGRAEGRAEGEARGIEKGRAEGEAKVIQEQIAEREAEINELQEEIESGEISEKTGNRKIEKLRSKVSELEARLASLPEQETVK